MEIHNDGPPTVPRKYGADWVWASFTFYAFPVPLGGVAKAQSGYAGRCPIRRGHESFVLNILCIGTVSGVNAEKKRTVWILLAYFTTPQVGMSANGELMSVYADQPSCSSAQWVWEAARAICRRVIYSHS